MIDQRYFDTLIVEESDSVRERIKNYTSEQRRFYLKGFADALGFIDLDVDLFINLILNKIN